MLARVCPTLRLVILVFTIDRFFHAAAQQAVGILRKQRIPARAPQYLDGIPPGPAENALQFLDDLAIAADRAIQPLQVAVDDKHQVVQILATGQ